MGKRKEEQKTLEGIEEAPPVDEAEVHVAEAREFVHEALRSLTHVVVDQCPGTEHMTQPELTKVREAHSRLLKVRDAL